MSTRYETSSYQVLPLDTPCVYYQAHFLDSQDADATYHELLEGMQWEKTAKINRWVTLLEEPLIPTEGDDNNAAAGRIQSQYRYRDAPSSATSTTHPPFTPLVRRIAQQIQHWYKQHFQEEICFNVCLLNFYQDGTQRIGWHCDREELGRTTPIASISLGAVRRFDVKHKSNWKDSTSLELASGSLIVMENVCQHEYLHAIPTQTGVTDGRINLTFRCKTYDTAGEEEHERRDKFLERLQEYLQEGVGRQNSSNYLSKAYVQQETCSVDNTGESSSYVFGQDFLARLDMDYQHVDPAKVHWMVCSNVGAECYVAADIQQQLNLGGAATTTKTTVNNNWQVWPRPWGIAGYVAIATAKGDNRDDQLTTDSEESSTVSNLLQLRSAHHVMEYHDHFSLQDVLEFYNSRGSAANGKEGPIEAIGKLPGVALYEFYKHRLLHHGDNSTGDRVACLFHTMSSASSFRAVCNRMGGPHGFRAPEVEREVGGAIFEVFPDCRPDMTRYDICIRVDVIHHTVVIGTQRNLEDLSKRHFIRFRNNVTIKCNLAYCMLQCAQVQAGHVILDAFCGSGTILLEALEMTRKQVRCIGLDVTGRAVRGAADNAAAEGCAHLCEFHCTDARALRRYVADHSVNCIVSNLPWGVMTGKVTDLQTIYEIFLRSSWYVLKDGGRIVMLVLRGLQMTRILQKLSGRFKLLSANIVRTNNNLPCLVVVEKLRADPVHDSIKGQLAHLSRYVNVSTEMYHALHMENIDDDVKGKGERIE